MSLVGPQLTLEEFLALGEAPFRYQLVDGELVVNEPKLPHQTVVTNVLVALQLWLRAAPGRGTARPPADFRLDDHNVFAPDVWWVAEGRKPVKGQLDLDGLPDLIVEARSPSTWRHDIGTKRRRYEAAGLPELWLVDTAAESVLVLRRSTPDAPAFDVALELVIGDVLTSPLLDGFALAVAEVFEP